MDFSIRPITRTDIAADAEMAARFVAAGGVMPICPFPEEHRAEWEATVKRFVAQHDEGESPVQPALRAGNSSYRRSFFGGRMNTLFETGNDGGTATTHDWLTPPEILQALGAFDLDPCASEHQPWPTAARQLTIRDNGLTQPWSGRVWCNPPYGPFAASWLERCAEHGDAIAFVFARTETAMFQDHVWPKADAMLFLRGRVQFRLPGGGRSGPAGAPSVLIAYGRSNADALASCGISGAFVRLRTAELEAA